MIDFINLNCPSSALTLCHQYMVIACIQVRPQLFNSPHRYSPVRFVVFILPDGEKVDGSVISIFLSLF